MIVLYVLTGVTDVVVAAATCLLLRGERTEYSRYGSDQLCCVEAHRACCAAQTI
jgi:hypothetical protein